MNKIYTLLFVFLSFQLAYSQAPKYWDDLDGFTEIEAFTEKDDACFGPVPLGFTFQINGASFDSVYINLNGSVSFTDSIKTYADIEFGVQNEHGPFLAPFMTDISLQTNGEPTGDNKIYYKSITADGENLFVVVWNEVGRGVARHDLTNTFQVVMSDNEAATIGVGNNVEFTYGSMNYALGEGQLSDNGFTTVTGDPASPPIVGIMDGKTYFHSFGEFLGQDGYYDGLGGQIDGIKYLEGKSLRLGTASQVGMQLGSFPENDTIRVCQGDTVELRPTLVAFNTEAVVQIAVNYGNLVVEDVTELEPVNNITTHYLRFIANENNDGVFKIDYTITDTVSKESNVRSLVYDTRSVPKPLITESFQHCADSIIIEVLNDTLYASFLWSNDDTTSKIYVIEGDYSAIVTDSAGCKDTSDVSSYSELCHDVYPGDADSSQIVDMEDLLMIGQVYDEIRGPNFVRKEEYRFNTTFDAMLAPYWNWLLPNGVDMSHADCLGEGRVSTNSARAVKENYGRTTDNYTGAPDRKDNVRADNNYLISVENVVEEDYWVTLDVTYEAYNIDTLFLSPFYGAKFKLLLKSDEVDFNTIQVDYDSTWLLPAGDESFLMTFDIGVEEENYLDIGMTHTDHVNREGNGKICQIKFKLHSYNIDTLFLSIDDALVVDADYELFEIPKGNDFHVITPPNGNKVVSEGLYYYNLKEGVLNLGLEESATVRIVNLNGQTILNQTLDRGYYNLGEIPRGQMHMMIISTESGTYQHKVVRTF